MISVCVPSRGRPEKCKRMIESFLDTTTGPIEFIIYINSNDPKLSDYKRLIKSEYLIEGNEYFANHGWNITAKKAKGSILFMSGDAEIMQTQDWDTTVYHESLKLPKRLGVIVPDDGRGKDGAPHFMVTRQWYELLGYMSHPLFLHWYVDTYAVELAKAANVLQRLNIVFKAEKIRNDNTAKLSRENKITKRDDLAFEWAKKYLIPMEKEKIERAIQS